MRYVYEDPVFYIDFDDRGESVYMDIGNTEIEMTVEQARRFSRFQNDEIGAATGGNRNLDEALNLLEGGWKLFKNQNELLTSLYPEANSTEAYRMLRESGHRWSFNAYRQVYLWLEGEKQ